MPAVSQARKPIKIGLGESPKMVRYKILNFKRKQKDHDKISSHSNIDIHLNIGENGPTSCILKLNDSEFAVCINYYKQLRL